MTTTETHIAKALIAFRRAEGFSLTEDQFESLVDQMALACCDIVGERNARYQQFYDLAVGQEAA